MVQGEADVSVSEVTVTKAVVEGAAEHPGAWLVDVGGDGLSHADFAAIVPAAASGLVLRGVRPGDVAVIEVTGARDFAPALHALTAAGAVPVLVSPDLGCDALVALLRKSQARILVTSESHAEKAVEASDRAYVRQVFAFGSAAAGVTPFDRVLSGQAPLPLPPLDPLRDIALRTYRPDEQLTHADRLADIYRLATMAGPGPTDVLVASPALCSLATWAGLVDAVLMRGASLVAVPEPDPVALLKAIETYDATIAVLDPETLRYAACDHPSGPPVLRVLCTGPVPPDIARRIPAIPLE